MAGNLGDGFNRDEYEPEDDEFDLLPKQWFRALCTDAELRPNNAGNGSYINLRWDIMGPTHEGRVLFSMITWEHNGDDAEKSAKAVRIGRKQLNDICEAMGLDGTIQDTAQLVNEHPVEIKVGVEKATDEYEAKNKITRYRAPSEATEGDGGAGYKKPESKKPSGGGTKKKSGGGDKPWKKSA